MRGQSIVYETLERLHIPYDVLEHEPVYTVEDTKRLTMPAGADIAKNLFLRDAKGKRHFLVMTPPDVAADLRDVGERLGSLKLSFASEDRLARYLQLKKGAVSLFGLLNDGDNAVEAVVDKRLATMPRIGFHPNDNTATVFITYGEVLKVLDFCGTRVAFV